MGKDIIELPLENNKNFWLKSRQSMRISSKRTLSSADWVGTFEHRLQ